MIPPGPAGSFRRVQSPTDAVSRRALTFVIFAIMVAAGCVRLGFWQLQRLGERRTLNAKLASRLSAKPVEVRDLVRDSATAQYRRARASGAYDFANEMSLAARTHQGSPGVNIVTPLRLAGSDTAILVNRGWVYSADAMTIDFTRWTEPTDAVVTGYLLEIPRGGRGAVTGATSARSVRHLDYDSLAKRLPYAIAPFMVVATQDPALTPPLGTARDSTPARLPAPLMDEGPHLGYAIQWFSFAVIALIGAAVSVRADRRGSYHAKGSTRTVVHRPETRHG